MSCTYFVERNSNGHMRERLAAHGLHIYLILISKNSYDFISLLLLLCFSVDRGLSVSSHHEAQFSVWKCDETLSLVSDILLDIHTTTYYN